MDQNACPNCGRISAGACPRCDAPEERTVLLGSVEEDQRTVLITGRPRPQAPPVADDERTVLMGHNSLDDDQRTMVVGRDSIDDQRTVVVSPDVVRSAPPRAQWGAPPISPAAPTQPPRPSQPAAALPLAEGYPEELTTSLTGSLLGARALPPRPVPKTSYRMVIPVLIIALLFAILVGVAVTMLASGAIKGFFDSIITAG